MFYITEVIITLHKVCLEKEIVWIMQLWKTFFRLKVEMFYVKRFESVNTFIDELKNYIDYYNNERISIKLKGMSRTVQNSFTYNLNLIFFV